MLTDLETSILKTLAYFDLFDFPLTSWEIWQYLAGENRTNKVAFQDVSKALALPNLQNKLQFKDGFYFLAGSESRPGENNTREQIISKRRAKYLTAEIKFKKFTRVANIFARFPFIKMITACNTLAYSNSSAQGDLDFFVVVTPGRLWLTRFLTAGLMQLLKMRPDHDTRKDKVCLSFFVSEKHMDLSSLSVPDDVYLRYWLNQLIPVYNQHKSYTNFVNSNFWLRHYVPNFLAYRVNKRRRVSLGGLSQRFKSALEHILSGRLGDNLERNLKFYQLDRLPRALKEKANKNTSVVVTDDVLKFHELDRRDLYRGQFEDNFRRVCQT